MAAVQRTGESVHAHGDAEARGARVGRHDGGLGAPGDDPVPAPNISRRARRGGRRLRVGATRRAGSFRAAVRRDPRLGRGLHEERHEHARRAPRQSARQVVHADVHLERVRRVAARVADHARRRGAVGTSDDARPAEGSTASPPTGLRAALRSAERHIAPKANDESPATGSPAPSRRGPGAVTEGTDEIYTDFNGEKRFRRRARTTRDHLRPKFYDTLL